MAGRGRGRGKGGGRGRNMGFGCGFGSPLSSAGGRPPLGTPTLPLTKPTSTPKARDMGVSTTPKPLQQGGTRDTGRGTRRGTGRGRRRGTGRDRGRGRGKAEEGTEAQEAANHTEPTSASVHTLPYHCKGVMLRDHHQHSTCIGFQQPGHTTPDGQFSPDGTVTTQDSGTPESSDQSCKLRSLSSAASCPPGAHFAVDRPPPPIPGLIPENFDLGWHLPQLTQLLVVSTRSSTSLPPHRPFCDMVPVMSSPRTASHSRNGQAGAGVANGAEPWAEANQGRCRGKGRGRGGRGRVQHLHGKGRGGLMPCFQHRTVLGTHVLGGVICSCPHQLHPTNPLMALCAGGLGGCGSGLWASSPGGPGG